MLGRHPDSPVRLAVENQMYIGITVDGRSYRARMGETVLTALRIEPGYVREFEFFPEKRAGFCLMNACQDCWLWRDDGRRLRACTTRAEDGMRLVTTNPETA